MNSHVRRGREVVGSPPFAAAVFLCLSPRAAASRKIVVEAKMTRAGHGAKEVGKELIVDIERYRSHPDCDPRVALVYDPARLITNRRTLESDLSGERDGLTVRVIVVQ